MEHTAIAATLLRREPGGPWIASAHTAGALPPPELDANLPLGELYAGLSFAAQER